MWTFYEENSYKEQSERGEVLSVFRTPLIKLNSIGGAHISTCQLEALELCVKHGWDVEFIHNDRVYRVLFSDLIEAIQEKS